MIKISFEVVELGEANVNIHQDGDFGGDLWEKGHANLVDILLMVW